MPRGSGYSRTRGRLGMAHVSCQGGNMEGASFPRVTNGAFCSHTGEGSVRYGQGEDVADAG